MKKKIMKAADILVNVVAKAAFYFGVCSATSASLLMFWAADQMIYQIGGWFYLVAAGLCITGLAILAAACVALESETKFFSKCNKLAERLARC